MPRSATAAGRAAAPLSPISTARTSPTVVERMTGPGKGKVPLHLVPVASTVLLLDDVAGGGQVVDDGVRIALRNAKGRSDVDEPYAGVVSDAQQRLSVVGTSLHSAMSTNIHRRFPRKDIGSAVHPILLDRDAAEDVALRAATGGCFTTEIKTTEAKTTEAKTTEAKTTEAKTTEAKTTEAKTIEVKTTEARRLRPDAARHGVLRR